VTWCERQIVLLNQIKVIKFSKVIVKITLKANGSPKAPKTFSFENFEKIFEKLFSTQEKNTPKIKF